jgi:hypothetical protein
MPVARSDPRRATIIGIAGVIVGVVLIAVVLLANNLGGDRSSTQSSQSKFHVGSAESLANSIREDGPLFFNDTATGSRPLVVQHLGDDPNAGWTAFDAAIGSCVLTWDREAQVFTDCNGLRYPPDGGGLHHYPVTVTKGEVIVDLSVNPTTTTSSSTGR